MVWSEKAQGIGIGIPSVCDIKKALKTFKKFGRHVGNAIKAIIYAYDPEAIILGGSVSEAYSFYKAEVLRSLESFVYN